MKYFLFVLVNPFADETYRDSDISFCRVWSPLLVIETMGLGKRWLQRSLLYSTTCRAQNALDGCC